ncbi:MAG: hypothetical protein AAF492_18925, partial [Verrucomicrobiota bacterium]
RSGTGGGFQFPSGFESEVLYIDVQMPGFIPWRQRYTPADHVTDTNMPNNALLVIDAQLDPLPSPTILTNSVDRFGTFLPGLFRDGDQDSFTFHQGIIDALEMNWTARVEAATFVNPVPGFDTPDGNPGAIASMTVTDQVSEVWMVDRRYFPQGPWFDQVITNPPPPTAAGYSAVRAWLDDIQDSVNSNQFFRQVTEFTDTGPGEVEATGTAQLWTMPPGFFQPAFIVITRHGAVQVLENYTYPSPDHRLLGLKIPPWLSLLSDIVGQVASVQTTIEKLDAILPDGRYKTLPRFSSSITEIEEMGQKTGFVKYLWELNVQLNEGMKTPNVNVLSLAPGIVGLSVTGGMSVAVNEDKDGKSTLQVLADLETDEIELNFKDYLPKIVTKRLKPTTTGRLKAGVTSRILQDNLMNDPIQFELEHTVGGGITTLTTVDLAPVTSKIPYAGPILLSLSKTDVAKVIGRLSGGIGLESKTSWQTLYPKAIELSTADPTKHVLRRHPFGGKSELQQEFLACFQFGIGLGIEIANGRAGASVDLSLQGNECQK